jgi:hypothetical protein
VGESTPDKKQKLILVIHSQLQLLLLMKRGLAKKDQNPTLKQIKGGINSLFHKFSCLHLIFSEMVNYTPFFKRLGT